MKQIIAVLLFLAVAAHGQVIGDTLTIQSQTPSGAQGIAAGAVGAAGTTNLYYFVATRYASGLVLPGIPVLASNTVGIANLTGVNRVQIGWSAAPGATGYYVIRGTTQSFLNSGVCTACVVVANTAATGFSDVGGATTNWPPAGVPTAAPARFDMILDNYSEASPYLRTVLNGVGGRLAIASAATGLLSVGTGIIADTGAILQSDEDQYRWRSETSGIFIGGTGSTWADWSAVTGTPTAFGSRTQSDFSTVTSLRGGDFRAYSVGGAAGTESLRGVQGIARTFTGTTSIGEIWGGNFIASHLNGADVSTYGVVGEAQFGPGVTVAALSFQVGVYGLFDDQVGVNAATNFTGAVFGVIGDRNTPGPDGAIVAILNGDTLRTAGNSPPAAFKVMDRTTTPGVNFNYGLDLYHLDGAMTNVFNNAAIRGQSLDMLNNAAAGIWTVTRGSGLLTGFGIEATAFANLGTPANGTMVYCSDCDPGAGAIIACASAGAQTGAYAFRIAGNWDCLSR